MENFTEQIEEAQKALKVADHLTYVTFPLIGDDKIMTMITDNLHLSLMKAIEAILNYDKYYKRISNIPEDFENKFDIFKNDIAKRYNINQETIFMIKEIKEITDSRKKPNTLLKKENYVFFTEQHKMRTVNIKKMKEYINTTKLFISKVNTIVGKNARRL